MENQKLKMNNAKFVKIWSSVVAIVVVLAIVITCLMNFFSLSMEIFLGRGEMVVTPNENMAGADTNFYHSAGADLNERSDAVAQAIAGEGIVLLKNNDTLPLTKGADVTPFGFRYLNPVYGGAGSGAVNTSSSRIYSAQRALNEYFTVNTKVENALKSDPGQGLTANGYEGPDEDYGFYGRMHQIIEHDPKIYAGLESSCNETTGIVFIGRTGGETVDLAADVLNSPIYGTGYADGTRHQLALSEHEKEMIRFAKANCDKVVVILNTNNVMEIKDLLDDNSDISADAILWIGSPGGQGYKSMAKILCGEITPSGKTVDLWMTDVTEVPSVKNFGNAEYTNLYLITGGFPTPVGAPTEMNFIEYEENIYIGYRYYETVHDTNGSFTVFGETGKSYDEAVQVPFGFGLSYGTDFVQEIIGTQETADAITLTIRVTNKGTKAGKDVVQLYVNPPYTDFDVQYKIEKSTANLIAFDKTGDIAPNAYEDVTLTIDKEDLASYCYTRQNPDGTVGAYVLEQGNYVISANKDSHNEYDSITLNIPATIWYDSENIRQSEQDAQSILDDEGNPLGIPAGAEFGEEASFVAAHNRFQAMSDYMTARTTQLTRASGTLVNTATFPTQQEMDTLPEGFYYTTDENGIMTMQQMDLNTNTYLGNVPGSKVYTDKMPTTNAPQTLTLADLRGKSYYDPMWDQLLDQLDLSEESLYVALTASYDQTAAIAAISKPATVDFDGPQGIVGSITDATEFTAYPSEPIIAATFNVDLAYAMGDMLAEEASAAGVNSLYGPAMNIHRTPFSGRNFEYYSEDPVLSGYMAIAEVSGCSDGGLITTIKHFALNDQEMYENDRSRVATWANEQAIREIYLKPFEMAIKDARATIKYVDAEGNIVSKTMRGATAVMGCMNYWGTVFGGGCYELNTEVLRHEWGFQGFVITDMMMNAGSNSVDEVLRSGSDTWMAWGNAFTTLIRDTESPTAVSVIRRAVKNMCYSIANSRAMNGLAPGSVVTYKTSPWKIWLTVGDVLAAVFAVAMIVVMVKRTKHAKANPELYQPAKVKANKK